MDEEANDQGPRTVIRGNSHLNHSPRALKLWEWRAREEVRCRLLGEIVFQLVGRLNCRRDFINSNQRIIKLKTVLACYQTLALFILSH